jgi:hypothetical protein
MAPEHPSTTADVSAERSQSSAPRGRAARGRGLRIRGALIFAPCAAVLVVAACLAPHPRGHGTHKQLGLPACSFLVRTGLPCPSCGMTTSMALMARGQVGRASATQPFGVILLPLLAVLAAAGAVELATGRDVLKRYRPSFWWLGLFLGGQLAGWGCLLLTGYASGTLPIR